MNPSGGADVFGTDFRAVKFHMTPIYAIFPGYLLDFLFRPIAGICYKAKGPI
jgi:hypothetical protein